MKVVLGMSIAFGIAATSFVVGALSGVAAITRGDLANQQCCKHDIEDAIEEEK